MRGGWPVSGSCLRQSNCRELLGTAEIGTFRHSITDHRYQVTVRRARFAPRTRAPQPLALDSHGDAAVFAPQHDGQEGLAARGHPAARLGSGSSQELQNLPVDHLGLRDSQIVARAGNNLCPDMRCDPVEASCGLHRGINLLVFTH